MLCKSGTSHGPVSVCLCLSVTSRCSTKTAKYRITQTKPHDNSETLVFGAKDLRKIRPGSPPIGTGTPNAGGVGQNWRLSTNNWLYLENGTLYYFCMLPFLCFLLCMFLLYITVLLPVGVIKDDRCMVSIKVE